MPDFSGALVEREQQLDRLMAVLRASGSVALVEGEAGAGKSTLLAAAAQALPTGVRLWHGRCEPLTIPAPFSALFEMLGQLPPALAEAIRRGDGAIEVFAAVLDEFRGTPTVLMVDDLQWSDGATAGLVRYLARRIDDSPSAIVCAYRVDDLAGDDEPSDAVRELGRLGTRIELPALTVAGVAALAQAVAPQRFVDASAVHHATGGNPLFTVEVLRHAEADVPTTVGDIVRERVRRLPIEVQRTVEAVALCPDGIDLDRALQLAADAGDHVDLACQRRILTVQRDRVQCRHDLIRAAIADTVPPVRRRQLHRELIAVLEPGALRHDAAILAHHSALAGDAARAVDYSLRAADDAVSAGTHRHAAGHLARALEFREAIPAHQLDTILYRAVHELVLAGRYDEAISAAEERLASAVGDVERSEALAQLAFCWTRKGGYRAGHAFAEQAVALAMAGGTPAPPVAHQLLAGAALDDGRYADAVVHATTAVEAADNPADLVKALITTGTTINLLAQPGWEAPLDRAYALASAHDLHDPAAHALNNLANCLLAHYRIDEARERFAEAIDYCEERQLDAWLGPLTAGSARLELAAGDWGTARLHLTFGALDAACLGSQAEGQAVLALLELRTGADGRATLDAALAQHDDSGTHWDRVDAAALLAEAAWLGVADPDAARQRLHAALAAPGTLSDPWAAARLAAWGRRLGLSELPTAAMTGPYAREVAGDPLGAAEQWDALGCPYEAALSRARCEHPACAEVERALIGLGADAALQAVRRDWARLHPTRVPEHPSGLTARQLEVLTLLGRGCTNAEIAGLLYISEKTAGHHVSAILTRFGVRSRRAAVALADREGWLAVAAAVT